MTLLSCSFEIFRRIVPYYVDALTSLISLTLSRTDVKIPLPQLNDISSFYLALHILLHTHEFSYWTILVAPLILMFQSYFMPNGNWFGNHPLPRTHTTHNHSYIIPYRFEVVERGWIVNSLLRFIFSADRGSFCVKWRGRLSRAALWIPRFLPFPPKFRRLVLPIPMYTYRFTSTSYCCTNTSLPMAVRFCCLLLHNQLLSP